MYGNDMQGSVYKKILTQCKNKIDAFFCHNPQRMFENKKHCLDKYRQIIECILSENVIPFWLQQTIDKNYGGFTLNHSVSGILEGTVNKNLIGQARMLWFFARVSRTRFSNQQTIQAAHHGYSFITKRLWDKTHKGFFWEVDHTGRHVTVPFKHTLAQSFAIYALAEYTIAFNHPEAKEYIQQTYALLKEHLRDDIYGGYIECVDQNWRKLTENITLYENAHPGLKTFNTHIHLLEALLLYNRILPDTESKNDLRQLLDILKRMAESQTKLVCVSYFEQDWRPCPSYPQRVNYGHDLESLWLQEDAHAVLDIPLKSFLQNAHEKFCYVLRFGYDTKRGGVYDHGPLNKKANARSKVWWAQAETLVCSLKLYQLTGIPVYINCFEKTLKWITKHQIDWHRGEWYNRIDPLGKAQGRKAENWKTPYHNGRALIICDQLLTLLSQHGPQNRDDAIEK